MRDERVGGVLGAQVLAIGDQGLVSAVNFLVLLVAGRSLPLVEFGVFSLAWSALIFIGNLHQALILSPMAVILPGRGAAEVSGYRAMLDRWHLLPLSIAVLGGGAAWLPPGGVRDLGLFCFLAGARLLAEFRRRLAFSLGRPALAFRIDAVGALPLLGYLGWCLLVPTPIRPGDLFLLVGLAACLSWSTAWVADRGTMTPAPSGVRPRWADHWQTGRWLLASVFANWTANQAYLFLTAGLLGFGQTAWLNGTGSILAITNVVMGGLDALLLSQLRGQWLRTGRMFDRQVWWKLSGGAMCILPVCLICIVFPEQILVAIYHEGYRGAAAILQVMGVAYLVLYVNRIASLVLQAKQRTAAIFWAYLSASIVTVAAGPWLLIQYQAVGAAIGYAINNLIVAVVLMMGLRRAHQRSQGGMPPCP